MVNTTQTRAGFVQSVGAFWHHGCMDVVAFRHFRSMFQFGRHCTFHRQCNTRRLHIMSVIHRLPIGRKLFASLQLHNGPKSLL